MMKKSITLLFLSVVLLAQSGEEVAKRAYEKISGYQSSISQTTMVLKNAERD